MTNRTRVRFAPSPTGSLHIGGLRTALYNFLFARKHQGDFILRIEDTDQERYVPGAVEQLLRTLQAFDLQPDEGPQLNDAKNIEEYGSYGPYIQSQRLPIYRAHAEKLLANGFAYHCFCTSERLEKLREIQQQKKLPTKYDGHCRNLTQAEISRNISQGKPYVIRMRIPHARTIEFMDQIRKRVSFSSSQIDDQVLMKTDGYPTYHLANVVDDHLMEISDVIRGEEWLSSVPKHVLLYEAFGWKPPRMAHLPILLDSSRAKLSKRKGASSCEEYLARGFLPDAVLNFLLLLGWNPKSAQEIFSRKEMIQHFSLEQVHVAGAIVDDKKLTWMNEIYLRNAEPSAVISYAVTRGFIDPMWQSAMRGPSWKLFFSLVQPRLQTVQTLRDDIGYFFSDPLYATELLINSSKKEPVKKILDAAVDVLKQITAWESGPIKETLEAFIAKQKIRRGDVLWPIRVAITGRKYSPGTYELLPLFNKEIIVRRLKMAIDSL